MISIFLGTADYDIELQANRMKLLYLEFPGIIDRE